MFPKLNPQECPKPNEDYSIRPGQSDDQNYIYNSWLKSYKHSPAHPFKDHFLYWQYQKLLITKLLHQSDVLIACSKDDPTDIYSYLVFELKSGQLIVHWIYTRHDFQNMMMATNLLNQAKLQAPKQDHIVVSHLGQKYCFLDDYGNAYLKKYKQHQGFIHLPKWAFEDRD